MGEHPPLLHLQIIQRSSPGNSREDFLFLLGWFGSHWSSFFKRYHWDYHWGIQGVGGIQVPSAAVSKKESLPSQKVIMPNWFWMKFQSGFGPNGRFFAQSVGGWPMPDLISMVKKGMGKCYPIGGILNFFQISNQAMGMLWAYLWRKSNLKPAQQVLAVLECLNQKNYSTSLWVFVLALRLMNELKEYSWIHDVQDWIDDRKLNLESWCRSRSNRIGSEIPYFPLECRWQAKTYSSSSPP